MGACREHLEQLHQPRNVACLDADGRNGLVPLRLSYPPLDVQPVMLSRASGAGVQPQIARTAHEFLVARHGVRDRFKVQLHLLAEAHVEAAQVRKAGDAQVKVQDWHATTFSI
jgi:hypothetical protein